MEQKAQDFMDNDFGECGGSGRNPLQNVTLRHVVEWLCGVHMLPRGRAKHCTVKTMMFFMLMTWIDWRMILGICFLSLGLLMSPGEGAWKAAVFGLCLGRWFNWVLAQRLKSRPELYTDFDGSAPSCPYRKLHPCRGPATFVMPLVCRDMRVIDNDDIGGK